MKTVGKAVARLLGTTVSGMALLVAQQAHAEGSDAQPDTQEQRPADLPADAPQAFATDEDEIIVMARRRAEALEDVPQTIAVVTGDQLEDLNIQNFNDLDKVVSGLQVQGDQASLRGVTFNQASVSGETVASYMNDAPLRGNLLFTSNFDVGQVEVLRGPQGTLRGIAAPSGAITITTRRADLNEFGGSVRFSLNNRDGYNIQSAVGVPIIPGVLAVRVAVLTDYTDGNGVRSVHSFRQPRDDSKAVRISLRFEPTPNLSFNLMWHHLEADGIQFGNAVFGSGSPGPVQPGFNNPNVRPGYNGPVLGIRDNRAVISYPSPIDTNIDVVTAQADWVFAGQKLSYVGSWQYYDDLAKAAADTGNMMLGFELIGTHFPRHSEVKTHELRLSSNERIAGIFDYVVGVFHKDDFAPVEGVNGFAQFLPGTFGPPGTAAVPGTIPNLRFAVALPILFPVKAKETSFFGNITAHIGDKLEISAGARRIDAKINRHVITGSAPAFLASINPIASLNLPVSVECSLIPGAQFQATYPGVCDIPVPAFTIDITRNERFKPWIWDAAISYHITPDLMVYGHAGSSWRQPPMSVGMSNPTGHPDLTAIITGSPEKSKHYEVGVKWALLNGRGRLFASYWRQKYDGFIFSVPGGLRFLTALPSAANNFNGQTSSAGASVNVPAKIKGFDIEAGLRITDRLDVSGTLSWADGKTSGPVPCNDGNLDGIPDTSNPVNLGAMFAARGIAFATCDVPFGTSTAAKWNARLTAEYTHPISDTAEAFIRGLVQYQPKNPNAIPSIVQPNYTLLDLWAGIRIPELGFELSVYARNITNTRKILSDINAADVGAAFLRVHFGTSGYKAVTFTPRREFGLNARIQFGSK